MGYSTRTRQIFFSPRRAKESFFVRKKASFCDAFAHNYSVTSHINTYFFQRSSYIVLFPVLL